MDSASSNKHEPKWQLRNKEVLCQRKLQLLVAPQSSTLNLQCTEFPQYNSPNPFWFDLLTVLYQYHSIHIIPSSIYGLVLAQHSSSDWGKWSLIAICGGSFPLCTMYVSLLLSTDVSIECVPMSLVHLSADVYGWGCSNHIPPRD